jgi:hypothetical protein
MWYRRRNPHAVLLLVWLAAAKRPSCRLPSLEEGVKGKREGRKEGRTDGRKEGLKERKKERREGRKEGRKEGGKEGR